MDDERHRRIRERAHQIWEREGCPEGQEAQHWQRAEREIDGEDASSDAGSIGKVPADDGSVGTAPGEDPAGKNAAGKAAPKTSRARKATEGEAPAKAEKPGQAEKAGGQGKAGRTKAGESGQVKKPGKGKAGG